MYIIHLTPANKNFKPHTWKEGGEFNNKEQAESYAKQLRKLKSLFDGRKNEYSKVEIKQLRP